MKRNIIWVMLLMLTLLFIDGCWGKREVEELAPLIGVGFDVGAKPGTYLITEQFALPKKGGGGSGAETENWTISVEASSAREAYEMIYTAISRRPFMGSLKVLVIGEDAAKEGFSNLLDFAQRYFEFRRTMYLVLAKEKAQTVLNIKLRNDQLPALNIKNHIEEGNGLSSFPTVRLGHYLTILSEKSTAPILPAVKCIKPGEGGIEYKTEGKGPAEELRIQGAGVFHGDRLVDYLTDEETKGYMWLEDEVKQRLINTVGIDGNRLDVGGQIISSSTTYKLSDKDGTPELQYQIKANVDIDEVLGLGDTKMSPSEWVDFTKDAEQCLAKVIQKECEAALQKNRELGFDFLGIGRHIEQKNPTYWKTVKDQWNDVVKDFPVSLSIQVKIHNTGLSFNSATNPSGGGQE